jgi:hypothetical protein
VSISNIISISLNNIAVVWHKAVVKRNLYFIF